MRSYKIIKKIIVAILGLYLLEITYAGSSTSQNTQFQYRTISALMDGDYSAITSVAQARKNCNFGLGAGVGLGEVVAVDGIYYIADPHGKVTKMSSKDGLSYLTCTNFKKNNYSFEINKQTSLSKLEKQIVKDYQNPLVMIVKITGEFSQVEARSEDIDKPPYTNLSDWMKDHQNEFTTKDIKGTLVITYLSPKISGVGVPGFHTHFISKDYKTAGHVLNAIVKKAQVEVQPLEYLDVIPTSNKLDTKALKNIEETHQHTS